MIPELDSAGPIQALLDIADGLLDEHTAARTENPERAEPKLLLDALAAARTLMKHAPQHPDLWQAVYDLADQVVAAAEAARADLLALDAAPRPYLRVILAARSLQITLADKAQRARLMVEGQEEPAAAMLALAPAGNMVADHPRKRQTASDEGEQRDNGRPLEVVEPVTVTRQKQVAPFNANLPLPKDHSRQRRRAS